MNRIELVLTRKADRGISLVELLIASSLLLICSLGTVGLIATSVAANARTKFDRSTTMLAQSLVEQISATTVGSGTANLTDCNGNMHTIDTAMGGARLNAAGDAIDFTETAPPANYQMQYVLKSPCASGVTEQMTYDVRWHLDLIGAGSAPKNTYLITVGAQMLNRRPGSRLFPEPVTLRLMLGN